jgi:hypothetical protein
MAQKITKVKGSQVIFSTRNLEVDKGMILNISSDGYEAGKIKVTKVGSSSAIGKIIEGSALVGDKVKVDKKSSPSIGNDDDSGEDYGSSPRKSKKRGGRSGLYGAVSINMLNFSTIETATGDFEFDAMPAIGIKFAKMNSKGGWGASFAFGNSTATFVQRSSLTFNDIKFNFLRLNFDMYKSLFTKGIYGKLGVGIASASITANIAGYGDYTLDLNGLNGLGGLGYQYTSGSWFFQLEGEIGLAYYMSSKATSPTGLTATDPGVIGQMVYGGTVTVGHSF